MSIKIDLSKVKTKDFLEFLEMSSEKDKGHLAMVIMVKMFDPATEGGLLNRPLTELPAILSQCNKVLTEFTQDVVIAVSSMSEYLRGAQDD